MSIATENFQVKMPTLCQLNMNRGFNYLELPHGKTGKIEG